MDVSLLAANAPAEYCPAGGGPIMRIGNHDSDASPAGTGGDEERRLPTRRKRHEEVADLLMRDIKGGRYPEGTFLPSESELMREFGVGRPAMRDCLAKLSRLGLVELRPGVRPKVRRVDMAPLLDEIQGVVRLILDNPTGQKNLQQIRLLLESALARHAAGAVSPARLAAMQELLDEFRKAVDECRELTPATLDRLSRLDFLFHRSLVEVIDNPLLSLLHHSLDDWLVDQRRVTLSHAGQPELTYHAHHKIYSALEDSDPGKAEQAMIEHLEQVTDMYWRIVSSPQQQANPDLPGGGMPMRDLQ